MTASVRPGSLLAICRDCEPELPQPFSADPSGDAERMSWASAHNTATGHRVDLAHDWAPGYRLRAVLTGNRDGFDVYDITENGQVISAGCEVADPGFSPAFLSVQRLYPSGYIELSWRAAGLVA